MIKDKLPSAQYANTVQTNLPIDLGQDVFYFEIKVKNRGMKKFIMIGLTEEGFKYNKKIGMSANSFGYMASGELYNNNKKQDEKGQEYGPEFGVNDIVGCGVVIETKQIFFTLNGRYLGEAFAGNAIDLS